MTPAPGGRGGEGVEADAAGIGYARPSLTPVMPHPRAVPSVVVVDSLTVGRLLQFRHGASGSTPQAAGAAIGVGQGHGRGRGTGRRVSDLTLAQRAFLDHLPRAWWPFVSWTRLRGDPMRDIR